VTEDDLDRFCRQLRGRVYLRRLAVDPSRLLGVSEAVWFAGAAMAGACWLALTLQGL
jgi:hypothetical protein